MELATLLILPWLAVVPIYFLRRVRFLAAALSLGVLTLQARAVQSISLDRGTTFLGLEMVVDLPSRALLLLTLAATAFLVILTWRSAGDELLPAVAPALVALAGMALLVQSTVVAGTWLILLAMASMLLVPRPVLVGSAAALKPLAVTAPAFVCFVLVAGWEQTYQLNPDFTYLPDRMAAVWGLAFAAILAVVPFHLVVPDLGHGRITGLVYALALVDGVALIQVLRLLGSRPWLPPLAIPWLLAIGAITALVGGLLAPGQDRLGRIVAYSAIADLGFLVVGVGTATTLGLTGVVLQMSSRILTLSLLAATVATIRRHAPDDRLSALGGLARALPWTTGGLVVGALAIAGLPPTLGFVGRLLILEALSPTEQLLRAGLVVSMAGVSLAYVRVGGALFGAPRRPTGTVWGEPAAILTLALALVMVALGLYPNPLLAAAQDVVQRLAFFSGT